MVLEQYRELTFSAIPRELLTFARDFYNLKVVRANDFNFLHSMIRTSIQSDIEKSSPFSLMDMADG